MSSDPVLESMSERFYAKTDRNGDCVEWSGAKHGQGYGMFSTGRKSDPKMSYAHRIAYELEHGPIPDDMIVCHKCDNPPCVKPGHLFLGTTIDNVHDRDRKGRQNGPRGEAHHSAKLTANEVIEIRARYRRGNGRALAEEFGITPVTVSRIVRRKIWRSVK